jgi:ABC-type transport system substrate-binding protein
MSGIPPPDCLLTAVQHYSKPPYPLKQQSNLDHIKGGAAWADGASDSLPGLTVTDNHTLHIELESPDPTLLPNLAQLNIHAKHIFTSRH